MWFILALVAMLFWSGSDLFSKIGCRDADDKDSHLKMVTAVGVVMGVHALYEILTGTDITFGIILTYLPVSALYILSMTIGYFGLRYIELSISSPICNSSGAVVAIMTLITMGIGSINGYQLAAVAFVSVGVIALGFIEMNEDEEMRALRQKASNHMYSKSLLAILLPVIYCILDAAGTFADNRVLEVLDEDSANVAYELTFLFCGVVSFIYLKLIKKAKFLPKREAPKYIGAICETAGQFAYIYAISDTEHLALSAPVISSYCVVSVILSRIFLKEKLSWKHYIAIAVTVIGIAILGFFDE